MSAVEMASGPAGHRKLAERVGRPATWVFLGALPVLTVGALFIAAIHGDSIAMDMRQFYAAAEAILRGESPYPARDEPLLPWGGPYPYPPLPALLAVPLTALSFDAAGLVMMACLVVVVLSIPFVLGVRDWRCYGLLLLWPPVISAIQTANLTLWLGLAAATAWRYRDRVLPAAVAVGLTLAAKFFLWPVVVWLAATRRWVSAAGAVAVGATVLVASWAVIGFAGFADYPSMLRKLDEVVGDDSYTTYIVGLDLGLPSAAARALWVLSGVAVLAAVVVFARGGDERSAFILAIAASLALTPIVWLHYFALLLVVVALAQPRLALAWFVPLAMVVTPGSGHPTPFETAATLAIAAVTVGLALRSSMLTRVTERAGARGGRRMSDSAHTKDACSSSRR